MGNTLQTPTPTPDHLQIEDLHAQENPITCEICIEPILLPNKTFKNNNLCSHPFCENCIIQYIKVKLEDNVSEIPCPALHCTHLLHTFSCRTILPPHLFVRWCDVLCEAFVLGRDICYCPYRDCSVLVINECGVKNLKKSKCPNCKKLFCFKCKLPWHGGFTCEERGKLMEPNDVAFGVLAERNQWKRCPNCSHFVQRISGCNKITCRCGVEFCYKCGRKLNYYRCKCGVLGNLNDNFPFWYFRAFLIIFLMIVVLLYCLELFKYENGNGQANSKDP